MKTPSETAVMSRKLDRIIQLLENLFILEASNANMNREELRKVVGTDKKRVNRISKHLGSPRPAE